MKNLFLSVVLLLTVSFAFANVSSNSSESLTKVNVNSFKSIDNFQNSSIITINSISELSELNRTLSNIDGYCDVSFTFTINVGVFSASGTISGSCAEAQSFFEWIMTFFQ